MIFANSISCAVMFADHVKENEVLSESLIGRSFYLLSAFALILLLLTFYYLLNNVKFIKNSQFYYSDSSFFDTEF